MKFILSIFCSLTLTMSIRAQHTAFEDLSPIEPTAAELQKYGEYPVGYYTGIPNISIPLYTIKSGDIEVPITLSYHASGIRVDQEASWVGLGWSLNAGGNISKQIRGNDDFGQEGFKSYFYEDPIIELTDDNKNNLNFTQDQINQYTKDTFSRRDLFPDLYFYNFNGYSGEFLLDQFPKGIPVKREDGLIFEAETGVANLLAEDEGFKVRDLNGKEFYFHNKERTHNYTRNYDQALPSTPNNGGTQIPNITHTVDQVKSFISSWNLTKIRSEKGREITFEYDRAQNFYIQSIPQKNYSSVVTTGHVVYDLHGNKINAPSAFIGLAGSNNLNVICPAGSDQRDCEEYLYNNAFTDLLNNTNATLSWSENRPTYLKRINFDQGYVLFTTSNREDLDSKVSQGTLKAQKLDRIEVYDIDNRLIKGIEFGYKYINQSDTEGLRYLFDKLCLKSIKEYNFQNDNIVYKKPYEFEYYKENNTVAIAKNSDFFDSWGYPQSSIDSNVSLTNIRYIAESAEEIKNPPLNIENEPSTVEEELSHYSRFEIESLHHETDTDKVKIYSLNKIHYPTGGSTEFELESNQYRNRYDQFFTNTIELNSSPLDQFNDECENAPCSIVKKEKYKETIAAKAFMFGFRSDLGHHMQPFSIFKKSYVNVSFLFQPNNITSSSTVRGIIKKSNGQEIVSFRYNFHKRFWPNYLNHDNEYSPKKNIVLPAGDYVLEIENSDNQTDFNQAIIEIKKYEIHEPNYQYQNGGGLRIKSMTNFDTNGDQLSKTQYNYTDIYLIPGTGGNSARISSGKLLAPATYEYEHDHTFTSVNHCGSSVRENYIHKSVEKVFSAPRTLTPMASSAHGQSIGYDTVTVSKLDKDNTELGKTTYNFENKLEVLASNPFNTPNTKYLENGQILEEKVYNANNDLIYHKENSYNKHPHEPYMYGINIRWNGRDNFSNNFEINDESCDLHHYAKFTDYKIHSEWWYMDQTTNTIYDLNGENPVVTTTSYEYDNDKSYQPTKTTVTTSKGETVETIVHYPDDITDENTLPLGGPLTEAEFNAIERLKFQGEDYQPATPIQTETIYNGSTTIERLHYGIFGGITQLSGISTATNDNELKKQVTYLHYDNYGNPRELKRENGIHVVYVWGYQGEHLIAKIENATYNSLPTTLKGGNGHLGLFNEAINLSNNETNVTREMQLLGILDETRNHTTLKDAMVTTYTYDPLIGMTNMVDPSGYKTSYTYDIHNRLHQVKDNEGNVISENQYNYKN